MLVVASVATQPRVPVHDAEIKALRVLVVNTERHGGHGETAVGCEPGRHHGVAGRSLVVQSQAQVWSGVHRAQQQALLLCSLKDQRKRLSVGKTQLGDRSLRDHHGIRGPLVDDVLEQGLWRRCS